MTARARLRALRLVGFKSFAERTTLEFGPGISAVVGPNGSGKSNLADALRWALGEQGRSLRTRRSEDVIFAGSARRHATGMADVSLLIDNEDRLLPVDYTEVDLGRRLYRSGENEYLLNRQSVRLRDLVDLLDAGNLADNAFLFIGQGMVDQALSLRPEERRPLFEEAAGVRRHERRKRQAEERLAEAEANLARVLDILAELRPQARRLAAQAEQQSARRDAAGELAAALLLAARARWSAAAAEIEAARQTLGTSRRAADAALRGLTAAEEGATALARALADRADAARAARAELDSHRARVTEARLAEGRTAAEADLAEREIRRLEAERAGLEARIAASRRVLSTPLPADDGAADAALAEVEAALAAALGELARVEEALGAASESEASLRRARAAREAESETLQRRAAEAARQARETGRALETARATEARVGSTLETASAVLAAAGAAEASVLGIVETARAALETADARRVTLVGRTAVATSRLEAARGRLEGLEALLAAGSESGISVAARRRGGRPLGEGLDVEPDLRPAVEAVIGDLMRAAGVASRHLLALRGERGRLVLTDGTAAPPAGPAAARVAAVAQAAGGGALDGAVRRDPGGHITRLLASTVWVPDLPAALTLRPELPFGWRVVTLDGEVIGADGAVALGRPDGVLERRAERERLAAEIVGLAEEAGSATLAAEAATAASLAARSALASAEDAADEARRGRAAAAERERVAAREDEQARRELAWETAQLERLETAALRAAAAAAEAAAIVAPGMDGGHAGGSHNAGGEDQDTSTTAASTWRRRVTELQARRAELLAGAEEGRRARGAVEEAHRRADVSLALEGERLAALDREAGTLFERIATAGLERSRIAAELAAAREAEAQVAGILHDLEAAETGERARLLGLEREAAAARERLRQAEDRARTGEVAEMTARLGLDAVRETLLVELAGLGPSGLVALREAAGLPPDVATPVDAGAPDGAAEAADATVTADLEAALDAVARAWTESPDAAPAPTAEPPSTQRLAQLRRRYHELGASNPFAAAEYAAIRDRLGDLEAQQTDLASAIASTRQLIAELAGRIHEQFRTTFSALEGAFARRFGQLFGGGEASLLLTDPDTLSQTGIEIMARPPGKKRQPLAALSGGERALTAVALLFAMLEVRPVPFCVLDEVDAALDEANVDRFVAALRDLARTTQCIVITHNRGTIEAADALYGVTIGDDAVSRVISLRLAEAIPARIAG